jgi:hypothetical protein
MKTKGRGMVALALLIFSFNTEADELKKQHANLAPLPRTPFPSLKARLLAAQSYTASNILTHPNTPST